MNPPSFLNRRGSRPNPEAVESGIRDILSKLKASADAEVFTVLASATNTYVQAMVRLTGQGAFTARDIDNLITVWQILLDVGRAEPAAYAPSRQAVPEPTANGNGNHDEETE